MSNKDSQSSRRLLRLIYPNLYDYLMEQLTAENIHPFDIQAMGRKMDSKVEIQILFGEDFAQELTRTFSEENLVNINSDFVDFCEEVQETCKETLIADYYKMVKP
ncbi:hypothetical protein ACFQ3N_11450 [Virgibacillus byunsanensis]|uniref:Uncharacterized protein n=1 Tax=Virgibacillus byunsanensis TaxID=570945 RepID=A0ABW3LNQ9_9BACI